MLTVIGVAVGSFVLMTSLAIGQGVQQVILGQLRKQDQLRRILVWPGSGPPRKPTEADLEVPGTMTEARRERLREAIKRRWQAPAGKPRSGLNEADLAHLARIDHVEEVTPSFSWSGRLELEGVSRAGTIRVFAADDPGLALRVVIGRGFRPGESAILVSEYMAYRCGMLDESSVGELLGKKPLVGVEVTQQSVGSLLFVLGVARATLSPEEQRALAKAVKQLPRAMAKLDMTEGERLALARILSEARPGGPEVVKRQLPIVGIFRDVERSELGPWDGPPRPVEIALSPEATRQIYFAVPGRAQSGLPQVSVRVDEEDNLRSVEERIKELGLETFSLADFLDQIRTNVLLISAACTLLAGVALVVAAMGITNTLLMSVLERVHEIGVMKAVGGREADVLGMFLMEGTLLGLLGASLGMAGAFLASIPGDRFARHLVATRTPMQLDQSVFAFPMWLLVGVPLLICLITTLAAIYPAHRAARIDPIEALRR